MSSSNKLAGRWSVKFHVCSLQMLYIIAENKGVPLTRTFRKIVEKILNMFINKDDK